MNRINYMLGDWARIRVSKTVGFVTRQVMAPDLANWHDRQIEPIPLTADTLEKSGWERKNDVYIWNDDEYESQISFMLSDYSYNRFHNYMSASIGNASISEFPITYVHELQHFLKLCRIDKPIIL